MIIVVAILINWLVIIPIPITLMIMPIPKGGDNPPRNTRSVI